MRASAPKSLPSPSKPRLQPRPRPDQASHRTQAPVFTEDQHQMVTHQQNTQRLRSQGLQLAGPPSPGNLRRASTILSLPISRCSTTSPPTQALALPVSQPHLQALVISSSRPTLGTRADREPVWAATTPTRPPTLAVTTIVHSLESLVTRMCITIKPPQCSLVPQ